MKEMITYLNFDGNTREAMRFYARCLGAELSLSTRLVTPPPTPMIAAPLPNGIALDVLDRLPCEAECFHFVVSGLALGDDLPVSRDTTINGLD